MKFCKNCGHELRDNAKVCTHCGTPVNAEAANKKEQPAYVTSATARDNETREPMNPKKKKKLITIISIAAAVILALFIIYKVLENMASPDAALDSISEAVTNEDAEAFKNAISTDISEEEALAYFAYVDSEIGMSQYQDMINEQKTYLSEGAAGNEIYDGQHTLLSIEENGSKYIFFDDYQFVIPKSNVYVEENGGLDTFEYEFNGETVSWNTGDSKFNELIPGKYNFEGTGIINETEEYNAAVHVNFAESYDRVEGILNADLYNVELTVPVLSYYGLDIDSEDISLTLNGEPFAEEAELGSYPKIGPFKYDEDYTIEGTVEYGGETFSMDSAAINLNADSDELFSDYDESIPYYRLELKFDEEEIYDQQDKVSEQEQVEENRESFEENMESNAEDLVRDYLNGLELMYMFNDIGEVEPYIAEGADILATLEGNLDSDSFGNMDIQRVSFSNYSKNDNSIVIDAETRRLHDDIDNPVTYSTRYNIQYNPETLELKITNFSDL